ncbi:hypothetical protein [Flexivirga alba]|uniref:Uncharacterized protein n=1 Tax=Flexivirga alba TaxID=702742 RepID=A0ABW2AJ84_9MICO
MQTVQTPTSDGAVSDARALALELAGVRQCQWLDPMALGVVLRPEEAAFRVVAASFAIRLDGQWTVGESASVLITSERLLLRFGAGELAALWWAGVVGVEIDVERGWLVLDYGDGMPRAILGPALNVLAVAAVWALYGAEALLTHRALASVRRGR